MLFKHLGQPKVLGQILGGIIVGPSLLGIAQSTEFIGHLSEIGVILLMFMAGLETDFEELKNSFDKSSAIAIGGVVMPFVLGVGAMFLAKDAVTLSEAIFVGVILTATSMGITVQTLSDLGRLRSTMGMSIFGKGHGNVWVLVMKIVAFFIMMIIVGGMIKKFLKDNKAEISRLRAIHLLAVSMILALVFAIFASELGMAAIIGAFFVGVIISTTQVKHRINHEVEKIGHGFFIPLFFANIGLGINLMSVLEHLHLALIITAVGIISKIVGSGIGARLAGFSKLESIQAGISMVPRAEVALIVANLGRASGMIGQDVFTAVILLVIGSTVATPLLLKWTEKWHKKEEGTLKNPRAATLRR